MESWDDYLENFEDLPIFPRQKEAILDGIFQSKERLENGDHTFFARGLPQRENWRAYPEFRTKAVFLDIETTGLSQEEDEITLIGLYDGKKIRSYIKGINLGDFAEEIRNYGIIVTYNGSAFDLPFIKEVFPEVKMNQIHIDLRYPLRRIGFTGGLKVIERRLGIERSGETENLDGWDAVRLWRSYERGDDNALDLLLRYNAEDVMNLETLMDFTYSALRNVCFRKPYKHYL